mmetsp:Transcript_2848/g.6830  ORF Transcript_2848/g.6830 Transcript_2848/m.6830 type:complete len:1085 (+) Transcript_2848:199-3453(+)
MVSRTPRHSSQPRPMLNQVSSTEAWDRANAVLNANGSHVQRRAQSSMRYQSNTRNPSRSNMSTGRPTSTRPLPSSTSQSRNNLRPRAISVNRLRQDPSPSISGNNSTTNHDDPAAVARQILDLRERRETSARTKRSTVNPPGISNSKLPRSSIPTHITTQPSMKSAGSSPTGIKPVTSMMSQEEIKAEERLRQAETKIGGMLQDLEELKFFQEIEMETPGPGTPRTPNRKANGPPTTIRAASPARGRLPPPPRQNKNTKGGGLETYKPLSPRSIARLDRNSLELECQTIVRKLQILEQERFSQQATIEMYEITLQEHDNDKTKIQRLETELTKVSAELRKQLYNIQKGKELLIKDYEDKLQSNMKKLHRTQEKADAYQADLNAARNSTQKLEIDVEKYRAIAAQEKAKVDGLLSNEETMQLQLNEARSLNATLVKKVEKKRSEVSGLKEDLSNSTKLMQESNKDLEEAHTSQIKMLEQQLNMSKEQYTRLEKEFNARNASLEERDDELNEAKIKHSEYEHKINDMMVQMEALRRDENEAKVKESEYQLKIDQMSMQMEDIRKEAEMKYEEGKKAIRSQEKRNAQKLVSERANASREYEQRITAMQEQLRHQTDRHHKEIEETRERSQKNLESMKEELREEIRRKEGDKANRLGNQLSSLRRTFDEEKLSLTARLQDAQQNARDAAEEFQRQDQIRQQELDHLHGRLNSYFNDFTEKDNEISRLKERLEESKKANNDMEISQKEQAANLERNMSLLESEKERFLEMEAKLNDEITTMKATYSKAKSEMVGDIEDLHDQVEEGRKKLNDAEKENKMARKNIKEVEMELKDLTEELKIERSRVEELETELRVEVSNFEGQLRASESALKDKKIQIENLTKDLDLATATSSKEGEEKQKQIVSLRKQLDDMTNRLKSSTTTSQTYELQLQETRLENGKLKKSVSNMNRLEDDLHDMKRSLSLAENEKKEVEKELFELKFALESSNTKVLEAEQRYSVAKEEFNSRLETKETMLERLEKTLKELQFELDNERIETSDLKRSLKRVKAEMERNESDLEVLRHEYKELKEEKESTIKGISRDIGKKRPPFA